MLVGLRRLVRISGIVMVPGATGSAQGLAQADPAAVVRIELSEYVELAEWMNLSECAGSPPD